MITESSVYTTDDGSRFNSRVKAQEYEVRANRVTEIMNRLVAKPDDLRGGDWVQQNMLTAVSAAGQLLDLIEQVTGQHKWIDDTRSKGLIDAHPSWVGRLLGDYDDKALNRAWHRIQSIDWKTMREYNQPYYADNPDAAADGRQAV
jgi:hypothetical protein